MQYTMTSSAQGIPQGGGHRQIYKAETLSVTALYAVAWDVSGYIWAGEYKVRAANSIEATKEAISQFVSKLANPAEAAYYLARMQIRSVVQVSA